MADVVEELSKITGLQWKRTNFGVEVVVKQTFPSKEEMEQGAKPDLVGPKAHSLSRKITALIKKISLEEGVYLPEAEVAKSGFNRRIVIPIEVMNQCGERFLSRMKGLNVADKDGKLRFRFEDQPNATRTEFIIGAD